MHDTHDPLSSALHNAIATVDGKRPRITPAEHRELFDVLATTTLRPELRAAIGGALGEAVHELPCRLSDVVDVERVVMLLPRPLAGSHLPVLRAADGYRITFGGPIAFVSEQQAEEINAAHVERVANRASTPAPWHTLRRWNDLRALMGILAIEPHGTSIIERDPSHLFADAGRRENLSLSAELQNLINAVVRAEPVIGVAWSRRMAEDRRSRETGLTYGEATSEIEKLVMATTRDALSAIGLTIETFTARNEALIARVVAIGVTAPAPSIFPPDALVSEPAEVST